MQKRPLGPSGLDIAPLVFGGNVFGWTADEATSFSVLDAFVDGAVEGYLSQRDLPDRAGTSRLSAHLHFGEISPAQILTTLRSITWSAAFAPSIASSVSASCR